MMFDIFIHRANHVKDARHILTAIRHQAEIHRLYPDEVVLINTANDIVCNSIFRHITAFHHIVVPETWEIMRILNNTQPNCILVFDDKPWYDLVPPSYNRILIP